MILGDLCLLVTAMTTLFWNSVLVDICMVLVSKLQDVYRLCIQSL